MSGPLQGVSVTQERGQAPPLQRQTCECRDLDAVVCWIIVGLDLQEDCGDRVWIHRNGRGWRLRTGRATGL